MLISDIHVIKKVYQHLMIFFGPVELILTFDGWPGQIKKTAT